MDLNKKLSTLEKSAIDVIAVFAPWLGPIPSAYLVGKACISYLHWHWPVALVAATAVESIGVVSVVLSLRLYDWNATRTQKDSEAPFRLSVVLVAIYFIVTIGLTVLLDVLPELARFAPAIFPLLAAVGAVNIAIKNGQRRREAIREGRKRGNNATPETQHEAQQRNATQRNDATAKQDLMAQHWQPGMGPSELARLTGVHKSTASRYINNGAMEVYDKR